MKEHKCRRTYYKTSFSLITLVTAWILFVTSIWKKDATKAARESLSLHNSPSVGIKIYHGWHNMKNNSSGHPVPAIQQVIDNTKVYDRYLTVATANMAHIDFVLNWRESVRRHLNTETKLLIISLDDELHANLVRLEIPTLHVSELFNMESQDQNNLDENSIRMEQQYGTSTYNRLVNMKIDIAYILLRYYNLDYLVYTDVDVVWLQPNLFDYFDILFQRKENVQDFDILFSSSGRETFYPCTGFYVARKSDFSVQYLDSILSSPEKQVAHDQIIATQVFEQLTADQKLRIYPLPGHLFMDGSTLEWRKSYNIQPWIFHANYVVGFEGKRQMLTDAGYWYINT